MSSRERLTAEKLIELHVRQNITLAKIGELYGISKQRVHQLKKEYETKAGKIQRRLSLDVFSLKHHLDMGRSANEIAKQFNMKPSKITRLIRKFKADYTCGQSNVRIVKRSIDQLLPRDTLYKLYVNDLLTDSEIAKEFQISVSSVNNLRKKYKIKSIKTKSLRKLPNTLTEETFKNHYLLEGYTLDEMAKKFNCSVVTLIKLKEAYGISKKLNQTK